MHQHLDRESASDSAGDSRRIPIEVPSSVTIGADISADVVFSVLASPQRRIVIEYLLRTSGPVPVDDVVERLAAWESERPIDRLSEDARNQAAISLRHNHLIKLVETGIISYGEDRQRLELEPAAAAVEPYLSLLAAQRTQ